MADDKPVCIAGRLVRLRFRHRTTDKVRESTVVYPARWSKSNVLASARDNHPDMTVRLVEWHPFSEEHGFEPTVWIVSPRKILGYGPKGEKR